MRNHGIGSWTARRARKTPHRLAVVHQGPGTPTPSCTIAPHASPTASAPSVSAAATASPSSARTIRVPGDPVRGGPAGRRLRPAQHPARRRRVEALPHRLRYVRARPLPVVRCVRGRLRSRPARRRRRHVRQGAGTGPELPPRRERHPRRPRNDHVHLGDHGPREGRRAQPRQPHLEQHQHTRRRRLRLRRGDPAVRTHVPHGGPQHDVPADVPQGRHADPRGVVLALAHPRPGRGARA